MKIQQRIDLLIDNTSVPFGRLDWNRLENLAVTSERDAARVSRGIKREKKHTSARALTEPLRARFLAPVTTPRTGTPIARGARH